MKSILILPLSLIVTWSMDCSRKELDYHKRGDSFFYDHYVCKDRVFSPLPKQYNYYETHEKELSTFSFLILSLFLYA